MVNATGCAPEDFPSSRVPTKRGPAGGSRVRGGCQGGEPPKSGNTCHTFSGRASIRVRTDTERESDMDGNSSGGDGSGDREHDLAAAVSRGEEPLGVGRPVQGEGPRYPDRQLPGFG